MDHEIILERGGRRQASIRRRCITLAIWIAVAFLACVVIAMLAVFILGCLDIVSAFFQYGSAVVGVICAIMAYLATYEARKRQARELRRTRRLRQWAGRMLNVIRRRGGGHLLAPRDDAALLHEESQHEYQSGESSPGIASLSTPESEIGMLARVILRRHSDPALLKASSSQATTAESRLITELRRSLNAIPTDVPGPVRFWQSRRGEGLDVQALNLLQPSDLVQREDDPAQILRRVPDSNMERQNLQTLDVQHLPGQVESWRMTSPEEPIPGPSGELRLRHPVLRPGLAAWPWQETSFGEEQQSTSSVPQTSRQRQSCPTDFTTTRSLQEAVDELSTPRIPSELARPMEHPVQQSRSERARRGQSWPTELTMIEPLQQAMDELSTPRISSQIARPVGLLPVQRSRGLTGGDGRPDPQNLDVQQLPDQGQNLQAERREYLPIPGAVSELDAGSTDRVQGRSLQVSPQQERPSRGPYLLVSQQEPGSHLQTSPLQERPAQRPRLVVSQRQPGILRIRQRASQGSDSRSQRESSEDSENPTEETPL